MATAAAKSGMAPLSIPATAELIHCWARGNSVNGTATHSSDKVMILARSRAATGRRAAGVAASTAAPSPTRMKVMSPGRKASSPMSIRRKDDPQMPATARNRPQSPGVNEPSLRPVAVDRMRLEEAGLEPAI